MKRETLHTALNFVAALYAKEYTKPQILKIKSRIDKAYNHSKQFETVKIDGKIYPVLYAQKVKDKRYWKTLPCFFCGEEHTHGAESGHRVPHCSDICFDEISNEEMPFKQKDGYVLKLFKM